MDFNSRNSFPTAGYIRSIALVHTTPNQTISAVFRFCKSTLWAKLGTGTFADCVKLLGPRSTWVASHIRKLIESAGEVTP